MHAAYARQKKHAAMIQVNDRVAYSAMWLKSTQLGQNFAKMRGTIIQIGGTFPEGYTNSEGESLAGERMLDNFALVQWDGADRLRAVSLFNLAKVGSAAFADAPHMGKTSK